MTKLKQKIKNQNLCKICCKQPRKSLNYCAECLAKHNKQTRELKRKYRNSYRCYNCGKISIRTICDECYIKKRICEKNSLFVSSRNAKRGKYNNIKEILKVI